MDVQEQTPQTSSASEHATEPDPAGPSDAGENPDQIPGGRYHIVDRLSTSALGAVYKALDTVLDRSVAVKCVRLDTPLAEQSPDELRERFVREARVAARLQHPNIVTIHDIVATPNRGYIIMEFIEGRTLESLIESEGRLPLSAAIKVLAQLSSALDYAHGKNVVHRDVKPSNILVSPDLFVWVTDFGIAKSELSTNLTMAGGVLGTPDYMSPEQAKGEDVDARSDLFSLGCILFEGVVGEKPFRSPSLTGVLLSIINDEPVFPLNWRTLGLPTELKPILHHSLEKDRDKRYASGAELMEALDAISPESIDAADVAAGGGAAGPKTAPPAHPEAETKETDEPTADVAAHATLPESSDEARDEAPPEPDVEVSSSDEEPSASAPSERAGTDEPDADAVEESAEASATAPSDLDSETAPAKAEAGSDTSTADDSAETEERFEATSTETSEVEEPASAGELDRSPAEAKAEAKPPSSDESADAPTSLEAVEAPEEEEDVGDDVAAEAESEESDSAPESASGEAKPDRQQVVTSSATADEPSAENDSEDAPVSTTEDSPASKAESDDDAPDTSTKAEESESVDDDEPEPEPENAEAPAISAEDIQSLKDESQVLHLSPTLSGDLNGVEISPEEGFLLSRIDGASRPNDIISVSPMAEADTARALMDLLGKGLIKLGGVTREPVASPPESVTPPRKKAKAPAGPDPEVAAEVDRLLELAAAEDYPALLGLPVDAPEGKRKSAYLKIVAKFHPDKFPTADDGFRDKVSQLCASASEAVTDFENSPAVKKAQESQSSGRTNGRSGSNGAQHAQFDKRRHARELYDRALSAYDRCDYWDAIQLGRQAVEIDEQVAEFYGLLGRALLQNKKWRKEAADNFLKASQLDPNNIEFIGMLGAIYQVEGLTTRATSLLERARTIDPDYEFPDLDGPDVTTD